MLTKRQKELFDFILAYREAHGVSPTYQEMMVQMGLKSKSGIHRLIKGLERAGHIRRVPFATRGFEPVSNEVLRSINSALYAQKEYFRVAPERLWQD